jgi:phage repressor protein C with HTH and peptisase S24 domain
MTMGQRIHLRRAALGLSQAGLAADLEVGQSTVAKWENGPNTPRSSTLPRLAARLQVTVAWLISGEDEGAAAGTAPPEPALPEAGPETAPLIRRPISRGERNLPVFGVAVGGDDAWFELNGQVHEYVERPAQLEGVHNGYALFVLGDSMEPRYLEGEIVYINPNRPVTAGSFVAVEFKSEDGAPGKGMIKQFVKRTPTKLVLRQLNPDRALEFTVDSVRHCHRIVQSGEP